jgi:hypothetical protein
MMLTPKTRGVFVSDLAAAKKCHRADTLVPSTLARHAQYESLFDRTVEALRQMPAADRSGAVTLLSQHPPSGTSECIQRHRDLERLGLPEPHRIFTHDHRELARIFAEPLAIAAE